MNENIEGEHTFFQPQQMLCQYKMPGGGNRQKFGESLHRAKNDCLCVCQINLPF